MVSFFFFFFTPDPNNVYRFLNSKKVIIIITLLCRNFANSLIYPFLFRACFFRLATARTLNALWCLNVFRFLVFVFRYLVVLCLWFLGFGGVVFLFLGLVVVFGDRIYFYFVYLGGF